MFRAWNEKLEAELEVKTKKFQRQVEMARRGIIVVWGEKSVPLQTSAAKMDKPLTLDEIGDIIKATKRMEMARKGFIVVSDERPEP